MPTYLRQKSTGDLYIFTSIMAKRDDMEIVDEPDLSPIAEAPAEEPPLVAVDTLEAEVTSDPEEPADNGDTTEDVFGNLFGNE